MWRTIGAARVTRQPEAFLIAWLVPSWIVFELSLTKLPHYTMPLYPAVALITARGVFAAMCGGLPAVRKRWSRIGFGIWACIGAAFTIILGLAVFGRLGDVWETHHPPVAFAIGQLFVGFLVYLSAIVAMLIAVICLATRSWVLSHACGAFVVICFCVAVLGVSLPRLDRLWFTHTAGDLLRQLDPEGTRPIAAVGFMEDSLVYETRARLHRIESSEFLAWLIEHPQNLILVAESAAGLARAQTELSIGGFQYTKGREVELVLLRDARPAVQQNSP